MRTIKLSDRKTTLFLTILILSFTILSCSLSTTVAVPHNDENNPPGLALPDSPAQTKVSSEANEQPTASELSENPEDTTPLPTNTPKPPILYYTQSGDSLPQIAARFGVPAEEITSPNPIPAQSLIEPGQLLVIPNVLEENEANISILPDSEIVFSPSAVDFDIYAFIDEADGYLRTYREYHDDAWENGAQIIEDVALENSINPRLLLALLEYQSNWVYGEPTNISQQDYPMGWMSFEDKGLYHQLGWAVQQLSLGYYGWRAGILTEITFPDGESLRLAPELNAGSIAIQYIFAQLYSQRDWGKLLYEADGFAALYEEMFGNSWIRAQSVEPLFPTTLTQPPFELPFASGHTWSLTGGPHSAWGPDGALAALDFAPRMMDHGCVESNEWVTASTSGLVVRSEDGAVLVDLDGDGREQTGWVILYMHIATKSRVKVGTWVNTNDRIGHPSCEGGVSTGTHTHMVRKYNGEWVLADGPMPFVLSGWRAYAGSNPYEGYLENNDDIVEASIYGSYESRITRP